MIESLTLYCGTLYGRYHLDLCANVFGNETYPEVDITNLYYGGSGITGMTLFNIQKQRAFSINVDRMYGVVLEVM